MMLMLSDRVVIMNVKTLLLLLIVERLLRLIEVVMILKDVYTVLLNYGNHRHILLHLLLVKLILMLLLWMLIMLNIVLMVDLKDILGVFLLFISRTIFNFLRNYCSILQLGYIIIWISLTFIHLIFYLRPLLFFNCLFQLFWKHLIIAYLLILNLRFFFYCFSVCFCS